MATINRTNLGLLHDRLELTITISEYMPRVEAGLKKLSKQVAMPGFRPGKTPASFVRSKYGLEVMADEIGKITNEELDKFVRENNIHFLGNPLALPVTGQTLDINAPADYTMAFELGLQPEFQLPNITGIEQLELIVDEEVLEKEIGYEQTRHGKSEPAESAEENDVVSVSIDNTAAGFSKTVNILISTIKSEAARKQIIAMKKDETISFDLTAAYDGDKEFILHRVLNIDHATGDALDMSSMNLTLKQIYRLQKAELNAELFEKVFPARGVVDIDGFKSAMKEELQKVYSKEAERKLFHDLQDFLVKNTKFDLPETFLRRWLKSVSKNDISEEQMDREFPLVMNDTRWTMIKNKIVTENNMQVQEKDLHDEVMSYLQESYGEMEPSFLHDLCHRILANEKEREYMVDNMINQRVMEHLRGLATPAKRQVSLKEFESLTAHTH
jgi:trigger factor